MKIFYTKKKGIKIAELWFANGDWSNVSADFIILHCSVDVSNISDRYKTVQHTLLTDLSLSEDELMAGIKSKTCKYEIRRNLNKDNVITKFYTSEELLENHQLLEDFKKCYEEMYRLKGMNKEISLDFLKKYAAKNALIMSVAYLENEPIVFHSYVCDDSNVRLLHSCSDFRNEEELASLIGRSNRRLHWDDWLYFKNNGFCEYDWGGVFDYESNNGIDQFKRSFGGKKHDYYNAYFPKSLKGKIVWKLREIVKTVYNQTS